MGLVMLRGICGLPLLLAPDRTLIAGERGESDRGGLGAKKGLLAASGLMFGGAVLDGRGAASWLGVGFGAVTRVLGKGMLFCNGEGACGMWPTALSWRRVKGLFKPTGWALGDGGALPHI